jgi:hypothetical protein
MVSKTMSLYFVYQGIFDKIKQTQALTEVARQMAVGRMEASVWKNYFSEAAEIMLTVRDEATKFEAQLVDLFDDEKDLLQYKILVQHIKQVHALSAVGSTINFDQFKKGTLRHYFGALEGKVLQLHEKAAAFGGQLLEIVLT